MSAEARDLACHLIKAIRNDPRLAYFVGPGSQTWSLLVAAIASITGEAVSNAGHRLRDGLTTERPPAVSDLVNALQYAVDEYGQPGGPWNVPSDPGGWLSRARAALAEAGAA